MYVNIINYIIISCHGSSRSGSSVSIGIGVSISSCSTSSTSVIMTMIMAKLTVGRTGDHRKPS